MKQLAKAIDDGRVCRLGLGSWAWLSVRRMFCIGFSDLRCHGIAQVIECFGAGTACIVSPVKNIGYMGRDYGIPLALGNAGELTQRLADTIMAIQYGELEHRWSVVIDRADEKVAANAA
jgi:hypothetical protein